MESVIPTGRFWLATGVVIVTVLAVWKVIDWRMQPPPPPNPVSSTDLP